MPPSGRRAYVARAAIRQLGSGQTGSRRREPGLPISADAGFGEVWPEEQNQHPIAEAEMNRVEYGAYLQGEHWKAKRREYWSSKKTRKTCAVCGEKRFLQLHHKSYKALWDEPLKHLVPLCRPHHEAVHDFLAEGRRGVNLWNAVRRYMEEQGLAKPPKRAKKTKAQKGRSSKKKAFHKVGKRKGRRTHRKFLKTKTIPRPGPVRVFFDPSRIEKKEAA